MKKIVKKKNNMKIRIIIILVLVITLGVFVYSQNKQEINVKLANLVGNVQNYSDTTEIENGELIIPTSITEIADEQYSDLTSTEEYSYKPTKSGVLKLTFEEPSSVKKIGEKAFAGNYIEEVEIPDSVEEIGNRAFAYNPLKKLKLGNSLKKIGGYAFATTYIKEVDIPDSVEVIEGGAFDNTTGRATVSEDSTLIKSIKLSNSLKSLEVAAFYGHACNEIIVPASVQKIASHSLTRHKCMEGTSYKVIVLNKDVKYLKGSTLNDDTFLNEKSETAKSDLTLYGYKGSTTETYAEEHGFKFVELDDLEEITIDDKGMVTINTTKSSIEIPETVKLNNVSIPVVGIAKVNNILGQDITSISGPSSLVIIKDGACASLGLTDSSFYVSLNEIGNNAFAGNKFSIVAFGVGVKKIGDKSYYNNDLTSITIYNPNMEIGEDAFGRDDGNYENLTIYGYRNSTAEQYANSHGIKFEPSLGDIPEEDETANYTIKYISTKNNEELNSETKSGKVKDSVTVIPIVIEGYEYNEQKSQTTGTILKDGSLILCLYYDVKEDENKDKTASYTVKYISTGNNEELDSKTKSGKVKDSITELPVEINGYEYNEEATGTNNVGVIKEDGSLVLKLYYSKKEAKKAKYKIDYYTIFEGKETLFDSEVKEGKVGDTVSFSEQGTQQIREIEGYELDSNKSTFYGEITEDGKLVLKFYYNKKKAKYIIKHICLTGKGEIEYKVEEKQGEIDSKVIIKEISIPRYKYNSEKSTSSGKIKADGSLELKIYYDIIKASKFEFGKDNYQFTNNEFHGHNIGKYYNMLSNTSKDFYNEHNTTYEGGANCAGFALTTLLKKYGCLSPKFWNQNANNVNELYIDSRCNR